MEKLQTTQMFGDFRVISQLGKGSFGTVYKATNLKEQLKEQEQQYYAVKIQQNISTIKPTLHQQFEILRKLKKKYIDDAQKYKGIQIPNISAFNQQEYFSFMAMDLLDTTLEDFANKEMKSVFSKDCLIRIFYSILKIIELIHKLGYVHRDIKPSNFMLKRKKNTVQTTPIKEKYQPKIYPIDLGLCKSFINPLTKQHIICKSNKKMVGTAIFCSLNTHEGLEQSRRDDIQSIVYSVTYLVKKLPWQVVCNTQTLRANQTKNQLDSPKKLIKGKLQTYTKVYQIKNSTDFNAFLNDSQIIPKSFTEIYKYTKNLKFQQEPNYEFIYNLLQKQHFQLTRFKTSQIKYECIWNDLCQKKTQKLEENLQIKKKIKINFKIPPKKSKNLVQQTQKNNNFGKIQ